MKVILVAVTSVNGKITKGDESNIYEWTSKEDQKFFFSGIENAKLIVCGSATYNIVKNHIKHREGRLRIVLTKSTEEYKKETLPGMLEFTSETPQEIISRLDTEYQEMMLVGGAKIYSAFMKSCLIDEIFLTLEPVVFGSGKNLFEEGEFSQKLELLSSEKLNERGTILLKYKVLR